LELTASTPIPDILKDVEGEVSGDGLTAALARRVRYVTCQFHFLSNEGPHSVLCFSGVFEVCPCVAY